MGNRYYEGKGVEKNKEKAKELYQKAAAQGCEDAKENLKKYAQRKPNQGAILWVLGNSLNFIGEALYEKRSEKSERIRDLIWKRLGLLEE